MMKRLTYLFLFFFLTGILFSQQNKYVVRNLHKLDTAKHDTTRIALYLNLASEYLSYKNDSAIYYCGRAETLLQKYPNLNRETEIKYLISFAYYTSSDFKKAQVSASEALMLSKGTNDRLLTSKCHNLLGAIYFVTGNSKAAIEEYKKKLDIVTELNDVRSIIESHYNISLINNTEGSYYSALEHNYVALHLAEKEKDTISIMLSCEGLGISYNKILDHKNAVLYLEKALLYSIHLKRYYEQSGIMLHLGNEYDQEGDHERSLYYYEKAEKLAAEHGDRLLESGALTGKGENYILLKNYRKALELFTRALDISKEIQYARGIAENHMYMALCNNELKNYTEAKKYANRSVEILAGIKEPDLESKAYKVLARSYELLNNNDSAYYCYRKHVALADTIRKKAALQKITEFEATLEKEKLEQERVYAQRIAAAELVRQKQIRNIILSASGLILLMLLFVYRNYRLKQKANTEIEEQKKIIEHKNKDILDSINYSKRLQEAALTSETEIQKLLPGSYVLYHPKGAVSRDFYFFEKDPLSNEIHVALGSYTGQGVPGAFMSIIAHNILKQALNEKHLKDPAKILGFLNTEINTFLRKEKGTISDGIDLVYCMVNAEKKNAVVCAAGNQAWKLNGGQELIEAGNSHTVGVGSDEPIFKTVTLDLKESSLLLLFSNHISKHDQEGLAQLLTSDRRSEIIKDKTFNSTLQLIPNEDICIIGLQL